MSDDARNQTYKQYREAKAVGLTSAANEEQWGDEDLVNRTWCLGRRRGCYRFVDPSWETYDDIRRAYSNDWNHATYEKGSDRWFCFESLQSDEERGRLGLSYILEDHVPARWSFSRCYFYYRKFYYYWAIAKWYKDCQKRTNNSVYQKKIFAVVLEEMRHRFNKGQPYTQSFQKYCKLNRFAIYGKQ